jgi:hypothetical protein
MVIKSTFKSLSSQVTLKNSSRGTNPKTTLESERVENGTIQNNYMNIITSNSQTDRMMQEPIRLYNKSNVVVANQLGTFNPNEPYEH